MPKTDYIVTEFLQSMFGGATPGKTVIDFDAQPEVVGTPTGRIVFEPIRPAEPKFTQTKFEGDFRWGESDVDPLADIQRLVDDIYLNSGHARVHPYTDTDGRRFLLLEGDYSEIEARVIASMLPGVDVVELGPRGGSVPGMNQLLHDLSREAAKLEKRAPPRPDYLKHDRTKSHKGRRHRGR